MVRLALVAYQKRLRLDQCLHLEMIEEAAPRRSQRSPHSLNILGELHMSTMALGVVNAKRSLGLVNDTSITVHDVWQPFVTSTDVLHTTTSQAVRYRETVFAIHV